MASRMRTCTNCGHTARANEDFYRKRGGWDSQCKPCRRAAARRQYTAGSTVGALPTRALINLLLERGWTVEKLARAVECTPGTLREVCAGQERVREVTARRVRGLVDEMAMARSVE